MPPRFWLPLALLAACDGSFLHGVPGIDAPNDDRCTAVAPPEDVSVQASADGVTIRWSGLLTGEYSYVIQKRGMNNVWGETGRVPSETMTYVDTSCVEPNSACEYRVVAASATCQTVPSASAFAYTLPIVVADFTASGDGDVVRLSWGQNNLYPNSYVVERSDEGGAFVELTTVDGEVDRHDDPVARNTAFCYRLSAVTDAGRGPSAESCTPSGAIPVTLELGRLVDRALVRFTSDNRFANGYVVRRDGNVVVELDTDERHYEDPLSDDLNHDYSVIATSNTGDSSSVGGTSGRLITSVVVPQPPRATGCTLMASATVASQAGTTVQSVEAALEPTTDEAVTAVAGGYDVTGTISARGVGTFEALWAPVFSYDATFEVVFNHRLRFSATSQLVTTPNFATGSRTGEGLQPWPSDVALTATACTSGALGRLASISALDDHTCVVSNAERVLCWGNGTSGQLGSAVGATSSPFPHAVCMSGEGPGCGGAYMLRGDNLRIATGRRISYAVASNGIVRQWGITPGGTAPSLLPVVHPNLDGAAGMEMVTVAAGDDSACGLTTGSRVLCWGFNDTGQMGRGGGFNTVDNPALPVLTSAAVELANVRSVSMGRYHACAIATGGVYCWGANAAGQAGIGSTSVSVGFASLLTGASPGDAKQLALGSNFSCGVFDDNVYCWGSRANGAIGDGGAVTGNQLTPVAVKEPSGPDDLNNVVAIAAGDFHACALLSSTEVVCWGAGGSGQLGDDNGYADAPRASPVRVVGGGAGVLTGAVAIAAGRAHTCAVLSDASVACWGANNSGQLGIGPGMNQPTPRLVRCDGTDLSCGPVTGDFYRAALRGIGTLEAIQ